ncbi:MAG: c-type cytochrome biogenesis protein CcmI [Burkholderiales bacterium]|jgi:cytochrome c-type biogenesis protein CcmH|nr:c-type cytochrome biogenesis protein CcmI [Burkholderiales bacterium]
MTLFVVLSIALAVIVLLLVVPPLLRRAAPAQDGNSPDKVNINIYRDQLRELEEDLAAGTIGREQHAEARSELERRLLEDTGRDAPDAAATPRTGRFTEMAIAAIIPVMAIGLYLIVGTPEGITPPPPASAAGNITPQQVEQMVEKLAARLKSAPDDSEGWVMLGRSYAVLERFSEAAAAYKEAATRIPGNAQVLVDYADVLAMSLGGRLAGEPEKLVQRALQIDPQNPKALAMAGTAAFESKQYTAAVAHWQKLAAALPADSQIKAAVQGSIAEAQALAGGTAGVKSSPAAPVQGNTPGKGGTAQAAATTASVGGLVSIDDKLKARTAPDDIVFIFARAQDGPPMPLAVLRKRVADLPFKFVLDDTMAMAPGMNLSRVSTVIVGARISKTGQPARQPGDLEGFSKAIPVGTTDAAVLINMEVR